MENQDVYVGGGGLQWHPAIRALGWIKDWILWAALASVLWECLTTDGHALDLESVALRAATLCKVLVVSGIVLTLLNEWLLIFRRVRRDYSDWRVLAIAMPLVTVVLLALGGVSGWIAQRIFEWVRAPFQTLAARMPRYEMPAVPDWVSVGLLAGALILAFVLLRPLFPKHARIWRLLGGRRTLAGYGLMVILRLRQPRRDFFLQAPLISSVPSLAVAGLLQQAISIEPVSWTFFSLAVVSRLGWTLDHLLPPAWVFLGRSHHDSFRTFDVLRAAWGLFGITLLDRDSPEWSGYYFARARELVRDGLVVAGLMNKPRTPRVWSLRSRGELWESTVAHLMRTAAVVVVDARTKSYFVYDEILWLAELRWIDKAWLLGEPDGTAPALDGALAWAEKDGVALPPGAGVQLAGRVVTEEQLYGGAWTTHGLRIER